MMVVRGSLGLSAHSLEAGGGAVLRGEERLVLSANEDGEVLLSDLA